MNLRYIKQPLKDIIRQIEKKDKRISKLDKIVFDMRYYQNSQQLEPKIEEK